MKHKFFVNVTDMQSLEHYAASLLSAIISLNTLDAWQIQANKIGILDEDEKETSVTISWELDRLKNLYKVQVQQILERTEIKEEEIMDQLKSMMPELKKKVKK